MIRFLHDHSTVYFHVLDLREPRIQYIEAILIVMLNYCMH